jgi:hypothetical protein
MPLMEAIRLYCARPGYGDDLKLVSLKEIAPAEPTTLPVAGGN